MENYVSDLLLQRGQEINEKWTNEVTALKEEQRLQNVSQDMYRANNQKFITIIIESFSLDEQKRIEKLETFAKEQIQLGWPLSYFTKGFQLFKQVIFQILKDGMAQETENTLLSIYEHVQQVTDTIIDQIIREYTGSWENKDTLQKMALRELSAPLIPVFDEISVMPLVGTIDTDRAKLIMENLLNGVIKYESQVVLIDITGVPVVDTMVAHHLIQSSEAVRLVGAECILVGIRPEIAQTIVNLGINLSKFPTTSSLRKGIQLALSLTNRKIVERQEEVEHE